MVDSQDTIEPASTDSEDDTPTEDDFGHQHGAERRRQFCQFYYYCQFYYR